MLLRMWLVWLAIGYFCVQSLVYAQDHRQQAQTGQAGEQTPWEHLTLESALAIAVAVQYRENRAKEAAATSRDRDMSAMIAKATAILEQATAALERLSERVDQCPVRLGMADYPKRKGD